MKAILIQEVLNAMKNHLTEEQSFLLKQTLEKVMSNFHIPSSSDQLSENAQETNTKLLNLFLAAKKIEGCSPNTLKYYSATILNMLDFVQKNVCTMETNDIRFYLSHYQSNRNASKITLDNIRRIFSSFFTWLEDEEYIIKSPVRRIHKVKTTQIVKETFSDENLEQLRDHCTNPRNLAMIDLLISTGIRVGELVNLNRIDLNFEERECVVLGKGDKERRVYFDAKAKLHLQQYLDSRTDDNPALFVTLTAPWSRLTIAGVERCLKKLGASSSIRHVHPHKFRRTMATMAIEKGKPIEQVQRLLGHSQIDTTLHYAIVNQTNVKLSHRRYIS